MVSQLICFVFYMLLDNIESIIIHFITEMCPVAVSIIHYALSLGYGASKLANRLNNCDNLNKNVNHGKSATFNAIN